jgi:hypothetical protein
MVDMSDEAREQVQAWVDQCMEYWSTFDPSARITEDMVDGQPMPPDEFLMDASAVLTEALASVLEMNRSGSVVPTVESRLALGELLDGAVDRALTGMDRDTRVEITGRLWDRMLDGEP